MNIITPHLGHYNTILYLWAECAYHVQLSWDGGTFLPKSRHSLFKFLLLIIISCMFGILLSIQLQSVQTL